MKVLIVDDHPLVCSGIKNILISEVDIENVEQANDIKTAMESMSTQAFDLALVDMRLKNENGLDFISYAKANYPNSKFMILSSSSSPSDFERAIQAGVDGYILKDAFPEDIVYAVKAVLRGRKYFDPVFMERKNFLIDQNSQGFTTDSTLSHREKEILDCLGKGLNNKSIAHKLYISENTVKKHISSILAKLNLEDRTQAALYVNKANRDLS